MPFDDKYQRQVALLVRILPLVAEEKCFALKGGTAINLFYRDMPRLSVDIDLTYIPLAPRPAALKEIDTAMKRIAVRITAAIPAAKRRTCPAKHPSPKKLPAPKCAVSAYLTLDTRCYNFPAKEVWILLHAPEGQVDSTGTLLGLALCGVYGSHAIE
jgi:hypothetical protein